MTLLQAHSWLWHYLWVAPNVLVFTLGLLLWRRGLHREFPAFTAFAILSAVGQFTVYAADLSPIVSGDNFWRTQCAYLVLEGVLKALLVAEIFSHTVGAFSSLAKVGKFLIRVVGTFLIFAATITAAYAPGDTSVAIISEAHLLEQSIFLIETGLLVFIFLFAAYFRLRMPRPMLGIALGLAISSCVHLAGWAFIANVAPSAVVRHLTDYIKAGVYHVCILIWFYYLFVPQKEVAHLAVLSPAVPPPDHHNLEVWNQELERLLHS
jgi:hypothetical protein